MQCECDDPWHQGSPCKNDAAEYDNIKVSPELCTRCLFSCGED